MRIHHIGKKKSILNTFLSEIRDKEVQKDSLRFRYNLERIGKILAYELSAELEFSKQVIKTPLGDNPTFLPQKNIIICSILRAGLPLHDGVLSFFDTAESAFISAYRYHRADSDDFAIMIEYFASPAIEDKVVILVDPMLATGKSLVSVYNAMKKYGSPKQLHIVSVIGSLHGLDFINNHFPEETYLWIADIDDKLNKKGYILPGLGDAGDLSFGKKM